MRRFLASSLFVIACSCATVDPARVSGETLDSLGQEFVKTSEDFRALHEAGKVSDSQYEAYKEFATKFKLTYPIAIHLYALGLSLSNDGMTGEAVNMIAVLSGDLAKFAADLLAIKGQAP